MHVRSAAPARDTETPAAVQSPQPLPVPRAAVGGRAEARSRGPRAPRNPWESRSYEWLADSPPSVHNFDDGLTVTRGPYDYEAPE